MYFILDGKEFRVMERPRYTKDSGEEITEEEWEAAVECVASALEREAVEELQKLQQEKGRTWWVLLHHGFGTAIRNHLRKHGFNWGSISLDEHWAELVEEAVHRARR